MNLILREVNNHSQLPFMIRSKKQTLVQQAVLVVADKLILFSNLHY